MANKKIGLDIAINGESQYRQALQALNKELKTLGTEAKKLQAVYAEDANSYDALLAKSKNLGARYDEITNKTDELRKAITASQEAQAKWSERQSALGARLEELRKITAGTAEEQEKLNKKIAAAESTYKRHGENIEYAARREKDYTQQLNLAEAEQANVSRELNKTNKYLQEAATSFDGTAHSIDRYGNEVKDAAEDTRSFSDAADLLAKAIVASGAIEGAERLRDAIVATAKSSIEYESAFAGVRKTVDGTAEELAEISDGLREMSNEIPIAATELAGIAENAGQLGISTGGIIGFTEVMAQLGVTTNLSAEEAASSLAKFANVTKMSESQYSNLGSSIVALGNNFATTEADIVAMATRLASTGEVVGLTEPQILAVATALSSVGIEAEAGGSAFSKLLKTIETAVESGSDSVQQYADIAGKSVEEFSAAWREDAVSALSDFIDGLGRLESEGTSTVTVLNDLGLTEVRLSNAVLALASSEGILSEALELSNTAWAENTALAEEAAVRFETTESKLQLLENAFENLKITVGDEFVGTFGGAIEGLTELTQAADEYVRANPDVVAGLTAVAAGIGGLAVAGTVTPLISTLFKTISANPISTAIAVVLSLASAFGTLAIEASGTIKTFENQAEAAGELIKKGDELRESFGGAFTEINSNSEKLEGAIAKVEQLGSKTDLTRQETVLLQGAMNLLNSSIPGLALSYDDLGDSLDETIIKLRLLTQISAKSAESAAYDNQISSLTSYRQELSDSITKTQKDLDDARKYLEEISKGGILTFENGSFDLIGTIQDNVNLAANTMLGYVGDADKAVKDLEKELENLKSKLGSTDLEIDDLTRSKAEVDEYINDVTDEANRALDELKDKVPETNDVINDFVTSLEESSKDAADYMANLKDALSNGFSEDFVKSVTDSSDASREAVAAVIGEFKRLEAEYGVGSAEAQAFVEEFNTTWAQTSQSQESLNAFLEKFVDTADKTEEKSGQTAKKVKADVDSAGQSIIDHADTVQANLDALTKEYDSVYQSAKSSLGGIGGLFGEVAFTTDKSISDMISGMQTQADYFTGYMQNLQRASQIGINEGLVAALADGSDASAGYLQKIVNEFNLLAAEYGENSTEAQNFITDFNEAFEASSAAKDALARTMAGITTDFDERKGEILASAQNLITELEGYTGNAYGEVEAAVTRVVGNVSNTFGALESTIAQSSGRASAAMQTMRQTLDAQLDGTAEKGREAGENYTAGLAEGIQRGTPAVDKAIQRLVDDAIIGAVNKGLEIRSPSRVGMEQGEFYDEGIALGIERNTGTVTSAAVQMINKLESQTQSAAAAAGKALGDTMAKSMADALKAGQALRQAVESGNLTVDGKKVVTAGSVGIPSLTGQAAADWLAEVKAMFNLPDSYTTKDAVDFLNGGGAMLGGGAQSGGYSSDTAAKIDQAIKSESSGASVLVTVSKLGNQGADGKTWGYGKVTKYNPNLSEQNIGASRVVINQTFTGNTSAYQAGKAVEKAGEKLVYEHY